MTLLVSVFFGGVLNITEWAEIISLLLIQSPTKCADSGVSFKFVFKSPACHSEPNDTEYTFVSEKRKQATINNKNFLSFMEYIFYLSIIK